MNDQWKQDPRLKAMNPEKIQFLEDFAKQLNDTPKDQVLARFIAMSSEAQRRKISFSQQETALLTDILISHMDPAVKSRLNLFRGMLK